MTKLSSAQDAIKQAIEGGWKPKEAQWGMGEKLQLSDIDERNVFTDPLFWQALGEKRGWKKFDINSGRSQFVWEYHAHKWLNARLSNEDETKFWESLNQYPSYKKFLEAKEIVPHTEK